MLAIFPDQLKVRERYDDEVAPRAASFAKVKSLKFIVQSKSLIVFSDKPPSFVFATGLFLSRHNLSDVILLLPTSPLCSRSDPSASSLSFLPPPLSLSADYQKTEIFVSYTRNSAGDLIAAARMSNIGDPATRRDRRIVNFRFRRSLTSVESS